MGEARSREPLERDAQGHRILTHDRWGYGRGCRCDACTADHTAYRQEQRPPKARRDSLMVRIEFRVSEETAAEIDALTPDGGTRNTTARDILLGALEAGQGGDEQQGDGR